MEEKSYIEFGSTLYRGFISDNLYHDKNLGEVHFSSYIPKSYDGSKPYALFITIPGWDGWLFWGAGANLEFQDFGIEAQKYNSEILVLSLQFNACDELTAKQTVAITEYFLDRGCKRYDQHGGGMSFAHDEEIMGWLFAH